MDMANSDQNGDIGFYIWQAPSLRVLWIEGPNFPGKVILISRFQILRLILGSWDVWIAIVKGDGGPYGKYLYSHNWGTVMNHPLSIITAWGSICVARRSLLRWTRWSYGLGWSSKTHKYFRESSGWKSETTSMMTSWGREDCETASPDPCIKVKLSYNPSR